MTFYRIEIAYRNFTQKIIDFPQGKEFNNFNEYFEKDKNIFSIFGYGKNIEDNKHIYFQSFGGFWIKHYYDENWEEVYSIDNDGDENFSHDKEAYESWLSKQGNGVLPY